MDGGELLCNLRSCRRVLDGIAWVTFCSHIFCEEDGNSLLKDFLGGIRELQGVATFLSVWHDRSLPPWRPLDVLKECILCRWTDDQLPSECRACGAKLTVKNDVIKVDLDPTEQFRSMVLAGLQPEIVMEVCHRAINFWSYQMEQERSLQQHVSKRHRDRLQDIQNYYEQQLRSRDDQNEALRRQVDGCRQDLEKCREQKEIFGKKLGEKTRQCQRLRSMYDSLRKRTGSSMTDDWPSFHNPSVPAIGNPNQISSLDSIASRSSTSLQPLQPPPLPHLDLAAPQINSVRGMEMIPAAEGTTLNHRSPYAFQRSNHERQIVACQRHQQQHSGDPHFQHQQQHSDLREQQHHNDLQQQQQLSYNACNNQRPNSSSHQHGQPSRNLPSSSLPSASGMYNKQTAVQAPTDHRPMLPPPPPSLQPISYDDFVFAPILHNNRREPTSANNRRSSNSSSDNNHTMEPISGEARHHR